MNDRILPQMTGANGMNSVARRAGLYMAPDILLEAEHIPDTQHPACLSHGPVMHILIARTEVTRIPTTLEFATSATKDKTWIGYQIGKWKKESEKRLMGVLSRNWWVILSDSITVGIGYCDYHLVTLVSKFIGYCDYFPNSQKPISVL